MEPGIREFIDSPDPFVAKTFEWLGKIFQSSTADSAWHAQNFCRQLIAENPLHISSSRHAPFWTTLEEMHSKLEMGMEAGTGDYYINVNKGELVLRMPHFFGIVVLLQTILSPLLKRRLVSVYNFPEPVLLAFIKRRETRDVFFRHFASLCEDRLDIYSYYDRGLISHDILHSTLDDLNDEGGAALYITPPPEFDTAKPEKQTGALKLDAIVLPERTQLSLACALNGPFLNNTLAFYSYLWSRVSPMADAIRRKFETAHGRNCRCHRSVLSMRTLLPLLRAFVEQSIDSRTLVRRPAQLLMTIVPELFAVIDETAQNISRYLNGASPVPELEQRLQSNRHAEMLASLGVRRHWMLCRISEVPLALLLCQLDAEYLVGAAVPQLRQFLANKPRELYVAYRMPDSASLYDLRMTLATLDGRFSAGFPSVRDVFSVRCSSGVYLVSKPGSMTVLRCLMLALRITAPALPGSELQLPQSYALLRNYLMRSNSNDAEVQKAACYALVLAILRYTGGALKQQTISQLDTHFNSPAAERFVQIYQFLPKLVHTVMQSSLTKQEKYQAIRGFARGTARERICTAGVLTNFFAILERSLEIDSNEWTMFTELRGLFSRHSRGDGIEGVRWTGRRKQSLSLLTCYTLLLSSGAFTGADIAHFAFEFSRESNYKDAKISNVNMIKFASSYEKNMQASISTVTERAREFWLRDSFAIHSKACADTLKGLNCDAHRSLDDAELDAAIGRHYESSRHGHTFGVRAGAASTPEEILGFARFLLEHENAMSKHSAALEPAPSALVMHWIYESIPYCMPLSLEPEIYFEDCFFLNVDSNWPRSQDSSMDCIVSADDLPCNNIFNLLDHAVENPSRWMPSTAVTDTQDNKFTYAECLEAVSKSLKTRSTRG